jgi:hypothetical protein
VLAVRLPRTSALRIINNQPATRGRTASGVRGRGWWLAQSRPRGRHSSCEGCEEARSPHWQLAHSGTREGSPIHFRSDVSPRQARLRHGGSPPWVRLAKEELAAARVEDLQQREEHWVFADLIGKVVTLEQFQYPTGWPMPSESGWLAEAGVTEGAVFRAINKAGRIAPNGFSPKVIWGVVKQASGRCGLANVAPHDLRRTCARLCHQAGGELEQIQFLLGHVSVQTTERYLGCKQRLRNVVTTTSALRASSVALIRWDLSGRIRAGKTQLDRSARDAAYHTRSTRA